MEKQEHNNFHPETWDVQHLIAYMHYEMKWKIAAIAALTKAQMVEYVLKDEIDKE